MLEVQCAKFYKTVLVPQKGIFMSLQLRLLLTSEVNMEGQVVLGDGVYSLVLSPFIHSLTYI